MAYSLVSPPAGYGYATQPSADATAGNGVTVSATASRDNGFAVGAAKVVLRARDLDQADFTIARTGTTNSQGYAVFDLYPPRTTDVQATVEVGGESATSEPLRETVRDKLSAALASGTACTLTATGETYPAKPHHPVWLQQRITREGKETGHLTLSKTVTDASGRYRAVYSARCGADYALATYVPGERDQRVWAQPVRGPARQGESLRGFPCWRQRPR